MQILITILALLIFVSAQQSQKLSSIITLFRDHQLAERSELQAMDNAHTNLLSTPFSANEQRCSLGTSSSLLPRAIYHCAKSSPQLFNIDQIFSKAADCQVNTNPIPISRSRFSCAALPDPAIVRGDLFIKSIEQHRLPIIAAIGSIGAEELTMDADLTLISLGEIAIQSIRNLTDTPLSLKLISPRGKVSIGTIDSSIIIAEQIKESEYVSLGLFPQTFGVTP